MSSRRAPLAPFVVATCAALFTAGCSSTVEGEATASEAPATSVSSTAQTTTPSTTTTTTAAPSPVDPDDYAANTEGVYYFASAGGEFGCAILVHTEPLAGCQGTMPANAPQVPGNGGPDVLVPANALMLEADGPGEWVSIGDISFMDFGGAPKPLPPGRSLTVDPFTCAVDEKTGITCEAGGHGFTVSDTGGEVW
ncbi:hypothetical protein [Rhodococcus sp. NPDC047139]|uniref:hypothetical protein n=1 Tax=Rhodococcus sp. NPDC047139 TaxID=3155141 RepID=UPI003404C43D